VSFENIEVISLLKYISFVTCHKWIIRSPALSGSVLIDCISRFLLVRVYSLKFYFVCLICLEYVIDSLQRDTGMSVLIVDARHQTMLVALNKLPTILHYINKCRV